MMKIRSVLIWYCDKVSLLFLDKNGSKTDISKKNKVMLMPIVEWNDGFLIGVEMFDEHHKRLVSLLNQSYDEFVGGAPITTSSDLLDELFEYAAYHFEAEDLWMGKSLYPGREQHIWEHTIFAQQLNRIRQDFIDRKTSTPLEIMTFLKEWLANHILKSDADMGHFIASRKIVVS